MGISALFNSAAIWHWLMAYGLSLARPLALLGICPLFSRLQISTLIRGAAASALALPMIPVVADHLGTIGGIGALVLCAKEAIVGTALGLLIGAPFWSLDVAGDVIDAQRGATQGRLNDPAGFADVSITGTLLLITGIVLFVSTGGLENITTLLYDSWSLWPPLGHLPDPDPRTPRLLLKMLDQLVGQGVMLAAPIVIAILLADVAMLIVARIAPQLRTDDLALAVRNVVFTVSLTLYALSLVVYTRHSFVAAPSIMHLLQSLSTPGTTP